MEIEADRFVLLPSVTGGGVLVRRDQIVGARPNGPNEGSILYTEAGPSIYTSLTTGQLANLVSAERIERT
jgi:hypothetical protein